MDDLFSIFSELEPCPYLPDRWARQEIAGLFELLRPEGYDRLLARGWRRFGRFLFRPACPTCRECIPIRVPVETFRPSRSQRRVLRRNADIDVSVGEPTLDDERLDLFRRYHLDRTRRRGWPERQDGVEDYVRTFLENAVETLEFRYRLRGRLVGIAYVGRGSESLNSIYAFTDPEEPRRSLGTLDVLTEILEARRLGCRFLYLGFHVRGCPSMEYKVWFRPFEVRRDRVWRDGHPEAEGPT